MVFNLTALYFFSFSPLCFFPVDGMVNFTGSKAGEENEVSSLAPCALFIRSTIC
ncbi:hypothetical protein [Colwellia chukchiensis]|uniref:hypothetical protein n=1 Tax=Colwellia chukchiensis TaxID=641665 RepID=UPI001301A2B7|nr:hypothetical protein [Colwellia chukchiensis]